MGTRAASASSYTPGLTILVKLSYVLARARVLRFAA